MNNGSNGEPGAPLLQNNKTTNEKSGRIDTQKMEDRNKMIRTK